jgi:hypothetical protein
MIYTSMKTSVAVPVDEEMGVSVYSPAGQIVSTSSFVYPVAIPLAETRPVDTLQIVSTSPQGREYANGFQRPDAARQIVSSCFILCFVVITISMSIYGINQTFRR